MKAKILGISVAVMGCLPGFAQDLNLVPFYNTSDVSFVTQEAKTIWMDEVPGMPQQFWVLDQQGRIFSLYSNAEITDPSVVNDYTLTTLSDFRDKVHPALRSEYGAWTVSFHPEFTENKKFYLLYMGINPGQDLGNKTGGLVTLEEWTASGPLHQTLTMNRVMLTYQHKASYGVGCMTFGTDGYLYIANSDYGQNSQDLTHMGRKILRIDVDTKAPGKEYGIPADNPFVDRTDGTLPEIYAYGIRNVWGIHQHPLTGDIYTGEIGQQWWEEINIIKKGGNGGWANMGDGEASAHGEGFSGPCNPDERDCSAYENPFWAFTRNPNLVEGELDDNSNNISLRCIMGGRTFLGDKTSALYGAYLFSDTDSGKLFAIPTAENTATFSWDNAGGGHVSMLDASWIWYPDASTGIDAPGETRYFRFEFTADAAKTVSQARISLSVDNSFTVYVNGTQVGTGARWQDLITSEFTEQVKSGSNMLALSAANEEAGPAGALGAIQLDYSDGSSEIFTTGTGWVTSNTEVTGWQNENFDDAGWQSARVIGNYGMTPWGNVGTNTGTGGAVTIAGTAPVFLGQLPNDVNGEAMANGDGHDGIVYIGMDSFGYFYAVYVSWYGGERFHEIYRIDHPQLGAKIRGCMDPTRSDFNPDAGLPGPCTGTPVLARAEFLSSNSVLTLSHTGGVLSILQPAYSRGYEVYNYLGRQIYSVIGSKVTSPGRVVLPAELEKGLLHIRFLF